MGRICWVTGRGGVLGVLFDPTVTLRLLELRRAGAMPVDMPDEDGVVLDMLLYG